MKPRLLFSGYYGLGNAGDEAVLAGLLQGLREVGLNARITVLSANPDFTEHWHGVKAVHRMKPSLLQAISECDALVSGGGSLLQDVTSAASLYYYLGVILLAKAMGKRVFIAAQGMGPLTRTSSRQWTGAVIGRADAITVRDEDSALLLRECGVRAPLHVTADPAFLIGLSGYKEASPLRPLDASEIGGPGGSRLRVGLALRSWKGRDVEAWGIGLCMDLLRRQAIPVLLPMHEPHDRELAEALRRSVGGGVEIAPEPDDLNTILNAIGSCDVLVGMRLHALLLAANSEIPVVAWSYDPKVDALMKRLGFPQGLLPLDASPVFAAEAALAASRRKVDPARIETLRNDALRTPELLRDLLRA
jgi:polysaccharide pyruvyl transferase CsaB